MTAPPPRYTHYGIGVAASASGTAPRVIHTELDPHPASQTVVTCCPAASLRVAPEYHSRVVLIKQHKVERDRCRTLKATQRGCIRGKLCVSRQGGETPDAAGRLKLGVQGCGCCGWGGCWRASSPLLAASTAVCPAAPSSAGSSAPPAPSPSPSAPPPSLAVSVGTAPPAGSGARMSSKSSTSSMDDSIGGSEKVEE
eukprot:scaffold98623_cov99-Phaeocystis_antarctica.AAC.4